MLRRVHTKQFEALSLAHWLCLETSLNALSDAGYSFEDKTSGLNRLNRESTGVYIGNNLVNDSSRAKQTVYRWPFMERILRESLAEDTRPNKPSDAENEAMIADCKQRFMKAFPETNGATLSGHLGNTISGIVSNYCDLKGGGYTMDAACASSMVAVITACEKLASGVNDVALAGGVDLSIDGFEMVGFSKVSLLFFLSSFGILLPPFVLFYFCVSFFICFALFLLFV